jgi:DedD protein
MSDNPQASNGSNQEGDIKRKLVLRVVFAGFLIAVLLGALAFIDYLGRPSDEAVSTGPTFSSPVPVPRKEVSQPVKPAEPAAVAEVPKPAPAAEASTAPATPVAPAAAVAAPVADTPARPEVAAQPELPRQDARSSPAPARASRAAGGNMSTPAEGTSAASSQFMPEPEKPAAPAPQESRPLPAERTPAPPRLFSGFAVQAGVFADAQHAEELRAKLTLNGIPSTMEARVQVGPFKTREEAEAARQKLKALGIDGILLPPKGAKR